MGAVIMKRVSRRVFNSFISKTTISALPLISIIPSVKASVPSKRGARVVVVGGGWSGLSIAKYLMQENADLNVTLIERRKTFFSLPLSNLWLGGLLPVSAFNFRFEDAAKREKYLYLNAEFSGLDRNRQRIQTNKGWISYDVLVLAPGVEYDYSSIGINDLKTTRYMKENFPAGFVSVKEQTVILKQLQSFEKGLFVLTVPQGIYRCAASPYERACLIAAFFKRKNIKGKVVLIDPREKPAVNSEGFLSAFDELYGDTIEYLNSTMVEGVDPYRSVIKTDFDEFKFDGGAVYPRTRAARIIEKFGLHDANNKQFEADIDPFNYNLRKDNQIYISGDCRPMPFSKSASVAISEGHHIAKVITARLQGKSSSWVSPQSVCYSMVNSLPEEAILSRSFYKFDDETNQWRFDSRSKSDNTRSSVLAREMYAWASSQLQNIFGSKMF